MAQREIYRLDVSIGVRGDRETTRRLTTMERFTQRTERRMRMLDRVRVNPTARLTDRMSPTLSRIERGVSGFVGRVGKKLVAFGTAAAITLGGIGIGSSIKGYAEFEQSMENVQAVSGSTAGELEQLTFLARDMGKKTSFTAKDAADALGYMGMAGWKTQDMFDGLPGVLNLAAAGGTDLALTSK